MRKETLDILTLLAFLAVVLLSVPIVAGFFGTVHPALDSLGHFRAHFGVLMALIALPLLATSLGREAAIALVFALGACATTLPGLAANKRTFFTAQPEFSPAYRLLHMNLRFDSAEPELALALIERVDADVITLNEVSAMWEDLLTPVGATYPHRVICRAPGRPWGSAILSRRAFVLGKAPQCADRGSMAVASVDFGGQSVDVVALHLGWPWPYEQASQIDGIVQSLASLGPSALLAGDFNASPWSASVRRVAAAGALELLPWSGPTWLPLGAPEFLRFGGLTLDHVLMKGDVIVHDARRLERVGSDHLPVLVEFSLPLPPSTPTEVLASAGE